VGRRRTCQEQLRQDVRQLHVMLTAVTTRRYRCVYRNHRFYIIA
jgi:hypothetical protein